MNLHNQIKWALRTSRNLKHWIKITLESLNLKNRAIQTYTQILIAFRQTYAWALKTAKHSKKLTIKASRKTREAFLLLIDYIARKKFTFEQWSNQQIKPRWNRFIHLVWQLLLKIKAALIHGAKTTRHHIWTSIKYLSKQFHLFGVATLKASRHFLIQTGIFIVYCGRKTRHFAKLFYVDLVKDCKYSWRIFKQLLALLYKYSQAAARLSARGLQHTKVFLLFCLNKFWIFSKYFLALSRKYIFVALKLFDKGFKRSGVLITLGLYKFWQVLILFGQGLLIIARYLQHLFIQASLGLFRLSLLTLKAIDNGFKKTGFFLTLTLLKTGQYSFAFIVLLMAALNRATEAILAFLVQSTRILITFLWRTLKFLLWSPVILLNAVLPEVAIRHLKQYALLIRLDKPIGILLLLWPTLMALWIAAEGWPDINVLLVFVAGVFLMRSAGCAINDYADRDIDPKVKRTKDRPLASGKISVAEALIIFSLLCTLAFMLVLLMNGLTIVMSFVGLALAASYPFMKRYHYLPQVHLGAAFGWAVPMAFAAQANELAPVAWLLFFATVLWATAYDTMYAMVDREDDILIGAKSTAILFEDADTLIIGIVQALLILCFIMIGTKLELGGLYFLSVCIATGFAAWQQFLIKDRVPSQCFKAFLNNNWFGLVLFIGVFLEYQVGGISS